MQHKQHINNLSKYYWYPLKAISRLGGSCLKQRCYQLGKMKLDNVSELRKEIKTLQTYMTEYINELRIPGRGMCKLRQRKANSLLLFINHSSYTSFLPLLITVYWLLPRNKKCDKKILDNMYPLSVSIFDFICTLLMKAVMAETYRKLYYRCIY